MSEKRIPYHPIRGYATQEQWEKLQVLKIGVDMDYLIKQIKDQTKSKGKIKS